MAPGRKREVVGINHNHLKLGVLRAKGCEGRIEGNEDSCQANVNRAGVENTTLRVT